MVETKKKMNFWRRANKGSADENERQENRWVQIRLFPIWLRIIIVLALIALAMVLGVMVGYGVIGDGQPADALKWETWQHIIDMMSGKK